MILYFTGTGNSRFIARKLAEKLNDELFNLNDAIKFKKIEEFNSEKPYVFVLPTYAWKIPKIVEEYILKATFNKSKKCYVLMTCGSSSGAGVIHAKKLVLNKQLNLLGFFEIKMPENYIALFSVPEKQVQEQLIKNAQDNVDKIAQIISKEEYVEVKHINFKDKMLSGIINKMFYKFIVKSDDFYVKDHCIGCRKCERICPTNNICLENNKPKWRHRCTHCMACISICPVRAIEYEGKSEKKERYYLE